MDAEISRHRQSTEEQRPKPAGLVGKHPGGRHSCGHEAGRQVAQGGCSPVFKDSGMARRKTPGGGRVLGVRGMCRLTRSLTRSQRRGLLVVAAQSTPKRLREMGRRERGLDHRTATDSRGLDESVVHSSVSPDKKTSGPGAANTPAKCESE